ncbi:hypothetical protein ACP6C7_29530 [Mycolicibacterium septicum]|uniref:PNPLA domain-containing protein n=1 Tax=Mycolicibacterium septicum TaxID=98668 RepID=A0ABW9M2S2_9MYCO
MTTEVPGQQQRGRQYHFWKACKLFLSVPACLISIYIGLGITEVLDNTLSRMHEPGGASAGASSVASPRSLLSHDAVAEAIGQWRNGHALIEKAVGASNAGISVNSLLIIYLVADVLFIALPIFWMLYNLNNRASDKLEKFAGTSAAPMCVPGAERSESADSIDRAWLGNFLKKARAAAYAFLLCAVAVDVVLIRAVRAENNVLIGLTGGIALAKWVLFSFALVALLVGKLGSRGMRTVRKAGIGKQVREVKEGWVYLLSLRIQIGVGMLLLFLGVLRGDLGRQLDDAFLFLFSGWAFPAQWTLMFAVMLTIVMLVTANQCLRSYLPSVKNDTSAPGEPAHPGPRDIERRKREQEKRKKKEWRRNWFFLFLGIALGVVGGMVHYHMMPFGIVLIAPGILIAVTAIFSLFVSPSKPTFDVLETEPYMIAGRGWRYSVALAVIPLVVLSALGTRNGVRLLTINHYCGGAALIVVAIFFVIPVGFAFVFITHRILILLKLVEDDDNKHRKTPVTQPLPLTAVAWGLFSVAIVCAAAISPRVTGSLLGPWSSVFVLCIALALAGAALVMLSGHIRTWGFLVAIGFGRTPLIGAILLCFVINAAIDDRYSYHDVRLAGELASSDSASTHPQPHVALTAALDQWAAKQRENNNDAGRREIPLVFIASAGGGIRAAYWTALVMRCLLEGDGNGCPPAKLRKDAVFLASGISGGSLGLAGIHGLPGPDAWRKALQQDFLGPAIAALAFRDLPNSLLRIDIHDSDRATILERAWEKAAADEGGWLDRGLAETAYNVDGTIAFPLLVLNGTSVLDGCRVAATVLDLSTATPTDGSKNSSSTDCLALNRDGFTKPEVALPALPATKDVFDNTCSRDDGTIPLDIRLSTAALLSARFPYVSPTGTLNACGNGDRTFDLDGGLIDSSGALPLAMLWPEVVKWLNDQPDSVCYAPKLIIMENSYLEQTKSEPTAHPSELTAPLDATMATQAAATPTARQAAALAFQKSFGTGRCRHRMQSSPGWLAPNVVDFYPVAQPGVQAPLGWTLSAYSRQSLENEIISMTNRCAAEIVSAWFTGSMQRPADCREQNNGSS